MRKYLLDNFLNSLNNHSKSFSFRKEVALLFSLLGLSLSIVYFVKVNDPYYLLLGLIAIFTFILLILGIITLEQLTKFKNGFVIGETTSTITPTPIQPIENQEEKTPEDI